MTNTTKDKFAFTIETPTKWGVSYEKHKSYQSLIDKILADIYPDRIYVESFFYVIGQDFDAEGSEISIINKAIGNITVFKAIVRDNNIGSFEEMIQFVIDNRNELFKKGGIYFDNILQILKISERKGIENELKAIQYIESNLKSKNIEFTIKRTPICSQLDVIYGIDLILSIKNKDYYIQVKPLESYTLNEESYAVKGRGKIKKHKIVHYYIFVGANECLLFLNNDNLQVKNGITYALKENLRA